MTSWTWCYATCETSHSLVSRIRNRNYDELRALLRLSVIFVLMCVYISQCSLSILLADCFCGFFSSLFSIRRCLKRFEWASSSLFTNKFALLGWLLLTGNNDNRKITWCNILCNFFPSFVYRFCLSSVLYQDRYSFFSLLIAMRIKSGTTLA